MKKLMVVMAELTAIMVAMAMMIMLMGTNEEAISSRFDKKLITQTTTTEKVTQLKEGQTCTMIKGSKVIQIMPDKKLIAVTVPDDIDILLGKKLTPKMVTNLNTQSKQTKLNWIGSHIGIVEVDFGTGLVPLTIVVKPIDVKDCK